MNGRSYPKPPIVEAVVEFHLGESIARRPLLDELGTRLAERYAGDRQQQDRLEVSAKFQADVVSTSAQRLPHVGFLRSQDGLRLIGCTEHSMSVHVLAPYPGWGSFIEQVEESIGALPDVARKTALAGLSVRYIDRIMLAAEVPAIEAYLTVMPRRPEPLPGSLTGFHFVTQTSDAKDGTTALLTVASAPASGSGGPSVILDLLLKYEGTTPIRLDDNTWRPIVEDLHQRQREAFEACITDKARALFQ